MDLKAIADATCWQLKLPQNLLTRLEHVSGEFRIATGSEPDSKVVHIVIDDEISRMAKALNCLHQHRIADNIQTCPETIDDIDLSHLSAADRELVRDGHLNITWQRKVFRARNELKMTGVILPAIDGVEPALWPSAEILLHRVRLKVHEAYNAREIPAEELELSICMQESERTLAGTFLVDQMSDIDPNVPSWMVRGSIVERSITKRLTVHMQTKYSTLNAIPVTEMGHRRLDLLVESILRQNIEELTADSEAFNGPQILKTALLSAFTIEEVKRGEIPADFFWERIRAENLAILAPDFEAILRADSPLARRRILQFLCSATMRGSIYANYLLFNVESQHIYRSHKISLSPGVNFMFVCVSKVFAAENVTLTNLGSAFGLVYGSSVALSDLNAAYSEENLLRSIHSKQNTSGDRNGTFRLDQQFFFDRYNLHRYQSNKTSDLEQTTFSTPFIIPEDKSFDTIDLAPAMYVGTNIPRRRRKHMLKNAVDDTTLQDILLRKFQESKDVVLRESDIFNHFGDSIRVKAILNKIAHVGQTTGKSKSWTLRQEFSKE